VQAIVIPPFTLAAFESTVLNCFLFRQTDLISGRALWKGAAPIDVQQQRRSGKVKALTGLSFGHQKLPADR